MKKFLSVAALIAVAGAANAAVTGFAWREIPNTVGARPGSNPANDATHGDPSGGGDGVWTGRTWRTFDLLVIGAVGDIVNGVSFGGDNGPQRIFTNGAIFNHDLGSNTRSSLSAERAVGNAALLFDTYAEFGGRAEPGQGGTSNANPGTNTIGSFGGFAGVINLTGAGGQLQFTSFAPAGTPAVLVADAVYGGSLRVLRVTVDAAATFLGGGNSTGGVGLPGGVVGNFAVGNALPTPGAVALMGLAGIAAGRRRR